MTPLKLPKWLKSTMNVQNIQKSSKIIKTPLERPQQPRKLFKWPKHHWIPKISKIPLKPLKNYQNTPKLSQNTLNFLDLGCILMGFKLFCSFFILPKSAKYLENHKISKTLTPRNLLNDQNSHKSSKMTKITRKP